MSKIADSDRSEEIDEIDRFRLRTLSRLLFEDSTVVVAASSSVSKPFMCLDSTPVGSKKASNAGEEESSPSHCSDDPALLESNVSPPQSNMVLRKRIRRIKQGMKRYNSQLTLMRRDLRSCKAKIAEQQKQIVEYATRLDDNDKKNEETSRKFSTLLQVFTQVY